MASTYVNNLRLNEMATGDASGSWGTNTNTNLEIIGQATAWGTRAIANASTDNITIADGALDADRCLGLKLTGGGQACTVTLLPNTSSKTWFMYNATSYTLTFTCGSGANVAILAGQTKIIATDGLGSGGVVHDLLTAVNLAGTTQTAAVTAQGTLTVGVDDTGYDVQFFGATSGKSLLWDESADSLIVTGTTTLVGTTNLDAVDIDGATQIDATVSVGVDDTGYDVKFFGATSGKSLLWDESADSLIVTGTTTLVGTTNLDAVDIDGATQIDATVSVGVDDTGYDVKFFGATSGSYMLWDESADSLLVSGASVKVAGKESIYIPATAMYPSTTNGSSTLTQVETTALRPDLMALDFATGADEFAQFSIAFPKSWNEGTVTFQPFWTVTGTNTGTVAWGLSGISVPSDGSINTAFGTTVVCTALAFSGTSNDLMVSVESGAVTIAGSPAANDMCFFQVSRDVSADSQSGDARLLGIKVFFTTDSANDA